MNAAMIKSAKGRKIIDCVAMERVLTGADGSYLKVGDRLTVPSDVARVVDWRKPGVFLWDPLSGGCTLISTEPSTPSDDEKQFGPWLSTEKRAYSEPL